MRTIVWFALTVLMFAADVGAADFGTRGGPEPVNVDEIANVLRQDLPNRFPSVLSRDFRREQGQYEDFDNLFAMYLLYNLGRYSVRVNDDTKMLEIEKSKKPMAYPEAAELATQSAKSDSEGFLRRLPFLRTGTEIGDPTDESNRKTVP